MLFVIYDDLRNLDGEGEASTPAAAALATRSLLFERAFCQAPICSPSRASLMTGRRPDVARSWTFRGSFRTMEGADAWLTMPGWFKQQGYFTAVAGKVFHPVSTGPGSSRGMWALLLVASPVLQT